MSYWLAVYFPGENWIIREITSVEELRVAVSQQKKANRLYMILTEVNGSILPD